MKATEKDAEALAGLDKIVWPEHSEEELAGIVQESQFGERI